MYEIGSGPERTTALLSGATSKIWVWFHAEKPRGKEALYCKKCLLNEFEEKGCANQHRDNRLKGPVCLYWNLGGAHIRVNPDR